MHRKSLIPSKLVYYDKKVWKGSQTSGEIKTIEKLLEVTRGVYIIFIGHVIVSSNNSNDSKTISCSNPPKTSMVDSE